MTVNAVGLAACGGKSHEHVWSAEYTFDEEGHWLSCENCSKEKDKQGHTGYDCTVCDFTPTPTEGVLYEVSSDGTYAVVTGYTGLDTTVFIAPAYEDVPVTEIAEKAFFGVDTIEKVRIPGSVKSIGVSAFEDTINLTSVIISDGLLAIEDYAFRSSSGNALTEVILPRP